MTKVLEVGRFDLCGKAHENYAFVLQISIPTSSLEICIPRLMKTKGLFMALKPITHVTYNNNYTALPSALHSVLNGEHDV